SQNANEWLLPARTYEGNRYTPLTQITSANVASLGEAWETRIRDDGEQEASPIISGGTMYVSTSHDNVLALDAHTGRLKWAFPYSPFVFAYAVNRGVGVDGGRVIVATQDCHVIALDTATGRPVWNVVGCRDTTNSWYSMASYVYRGAVILGTAGGDNGNRGLVSAFSTSDGKRLWDWETLKRDTWKDSSWVHGAAAVWAGLAINPFTNTLFVAPGNPGPDMVLTGREGLDLYSNSLVALDISSSTPRVKWYHQIIANDTHDADPAMIPVLFSGKVAGVPRDLVAVGDKAGNFLILDQTTGAVVHQLAVSDQKGMSATVPTLQGTRACPNHGGGIEWNGGAYDPSSNLFVIPSTEECGLWKLQTETPVYTPGQNYTGGPLPKRENGTGVVSAIDVGTGQVRWRAKLPYPAQGGALVTATGLVFTSDLGGNVYAFDVATGKQLWTTNTGSAIVAPFSAFMLDGKEQLALVVGRAGNQQIPRLPVPRGSRVIVYQLGATHATMNDTTGQPALAASVRGGATESGLAASDSLPYTPRQVASGATVYATSCASCHGAQLQGVSAPALTGTAIARAHLNVSQFRAAVVQRMPLTAPGSLSPTAYANAMAYMLAYDCIKPSGGGKVPFPTTDKPQFAQVLIGSRT
ncbi:MAG TPA: PQQ-binding-like beta-propeller repeat protein, partial [Candidatus Elarobacter sp.]|nr:PQQ-binding-like beta-propeller repeat protein [Candidatus Elarobacter sp.]